MSSILASYWASEVKCAHPGQKLILLSLGGDAGGNGEVSWVIPNVPNLARRSGYSMAEVRHLLKELRGAGLIMSVGPGNNGPDEPDRYVQFNIPLGWPNWERAR